jgi:hypothetical protein
MTSRSISATVAAAPHGQQRAVPESQIPEAIRRVFLETFTARDIAEPLASFDASSSSTEVSRCMEAQHFDVVGILKEGRIVAFVHRVTELRTDNTRRAAACSGD